MKEFARLPVRELFAYFQETANRRRLPRWTVEKDFWICWMLGVLFGPSKLGGHLVFNSGWAHYDTAKPGTLRLVPP